MNAVDHQRLFRVAAAIRRNTLRAAEADIAGEPLRAIRIMGGLEGYLRSTHIDRPLIEWASELLDAFYRLPNPGDPRFCETLQ